VIETSKLLDLWRRLAPLPCGLWFFSKLFGYAVPYSGSVGPRVRVLEPGHAEVEIPDRRSNRNHYAAYRRASPADLRADVSVLQPRARRSRQ
jgi:Domain of unknown function (DUF4442)